MGSAPTRERVAVPPTGNSYAFDGSRANYCLPRPALRGAKNVLIDGGASLVFGIGQDLNLRREPL
jgi:hypothetical protein